MRFSILGPLEVATDEGQKVGVGGARMQTLLAALLVQANEVVSYDRLALALWPDRTSHEVRNALQTQLSRLRRSLEVDRAADREERLRSHGHGYRLTVTDEE